jgi:hypothetical protein
MRAAAVYALQKTRLLPWANRACCGQPISGAHAMGARNRTASPPLYSEYLTWIKAKIAS